MPPFSSPPQQTRRCRHESRNCKGICQQSGKGWGFWALQGAVPLRWCLGRSETFVCLPLCRAYLGVSWTVFCTGVSGFGVWGDFCWAVPYLCAEGEKAAFSVFLPGWGFWDFSQVVLHWLVFFHFMHLGVVFMADPYSQRRKLTHRTSWDHRDPYSQRRTYTPYVVGAGAK